MKIKDKFIFFKAKRIYKKTKDKISVIWYLNGKYPNESGSKIISIANKIEESV